MLFRSAAASSGSRSTPSEDRPSSSAASDVVPVPTNGSNTELPLRLVRMYSVRDDTVFDPFVGTGTTSLAALLEGRSSLGVEQDPELAAAFAERAAEAPALSAERARQRLERHREFVADNGETVNYEARHYDTRVVTKAEREMRLPTVESLERVGEEPLRLSATHEPL